MPFNIRPEDVRLFLLANAVVMGWILVANAFSPREWRRQQAMHILELVISFFAGVFLEDVVKVVLFGHDNIPQR